MKTFKRKVTLIITAALILTSVPFSGKTAAAKILPEIMQDTELISEASAPDYIEGDVIVCVKNGDSDSLYSAGEITNDKAAEILSLLDDAEGLMDVTQAVKESDLYEPSTSRGMNGVDPVSNDKGLPDEEYELKYVHSDKYSTQQMIDMLEGTPGVLFAEPNYIYYQADEEVIAEENRIGLSDEDIVSIDTTEIIKAEEVIDININRDESANISPDLTVKQYAYGNGAGGIDVPDWNEADHENAKNTVVAVLDTGVDYNHEDLKDVMWDDGLMYPELTALGGGRYGYNALEKNSYGEPYNSYDPMDDGGHGTHCAGIVGAAWNGFGISGTAAGTEIMAVKGGNNIGQTPARNMIMCFNYLKEAKKAGVNVVAANSSWGLYVANNSISLAAGELADLGVVCVFASGNDYVDNDYAFRISDTYRENERIIVVNANDDTGAKSDYSEYGIRTCDISAPGSHILSTIPMGAGTADPDLSVSVKDVSGNDARDDYKGEGTYFDYGCLNGASKEFIDDGGKKVLKVSGLKNNLDFMTITSSPLAERPKYFAICDKCGGVEHLNHCAVLLKVLLNSGKYETVMPQYYTSTAFTCNNIYELPEDMNIMTPEIKMEAFLRGDCESEDYYIDGISFALELANYEYKDGTSMATPAVTGEVAILASKWPGDSAERRAARVVGSTRYVEELAGTSRTDGIANVRKALDCDYAPVVNKAWVDGEGLLNIEGFFFGDSQGSISIASGDGILSGINIVNWKGQRKDEWNDDGKNDVDLIKVSMGSGKWPSHEVKITVIANGDKSGSRMLTVKSDSPSDEASFYKPLTLPEKEDGDIYTSFMRTTFISSAALNGYIYFAGIEINENANDCVLWRYSLVGDGIKSPWEKINRNIYFSDKIDFEWDPSKIRNFSDICAWNGLLVYLDENDKRIKLYSPDDDILYDPKLTIPDIEDVKYSHAGFVNAENDLYMLFSTKESNQFDNYFVKETVLYRIDIKKGAVEKLGTLGTGLLYPALSAYKDEDGHTVIDSLTRVDGTDLAEDIISISGNEVIFNSREIKLPEGCNLDSEYLRGARNQYGIVLAGPADMTDNTDNFLYDPTDGLIKKCAKQIIPGRPFGTLVTEYKGYTYFLCLDYYSRKGAAFVYADDNEFKGTESVKEPLYCYGDDHVIPVVGTAIEVDINAENDGKIPVGKTIKVTPSVTEEVGNTINYTWYSDDASIALTDQSGKVTGKTTGSTCIHAVGRDSAGNVYEGRCDVSIYAPAKRIKLSAKNLTVSGGDEFTLSAALTPEYALKEKLEWSVSLPTEGFGAVEKIREGINDGKCYATFKVGNVDKKLQVKIIARMTDGSNKSESCSVIVNGPAGGNVSTAPVKSAAFSDAGTIYLGEGMEHKVSLVRIIPDNCGEYTVEWKSSDPAVTSVSKKDENYAVLRGEKKGTSKITAVITNKAPGGKETITLKGLTVKVVQSAIYGDSVKIFNKKTDVTDKTSVNRLAVGKSVTLKAEVYKDGQALKAGKTAIIWTSSDPERATVVNGKVKAYREGEVTFTASVVPTGALTSESSEPVSASCTFYVYNPVKDIRFDSYRVYETGGIKTDELLMEGIGDARIPFVSEAALYLKARGITDPTTDKDSVREDKEFDFVSSKPDVVSISEDPTGCVVLTPKATGKAVITAVAKDGSKKKAKFTVTVYNRVIGIKLAATNIGRSTVSGNNTDNVTVSGLAVNKTFKIKEDVEPVNAVNKTVTYISTNPQAVTVNNKGLVKRVGTGNADIYVITVDGGCTAVCHVIE